MTQGEGVSQKLAIARPGALAPGAGPCRSASFSERASLCGTAVGDQIGWLQNGWRAVDDGRTPIVQRMGGWGGNTLFMDRPPLPSNPSRVVDAVQKKKKRVVTPPAALCAMKSTRAPSSSRGVQWGPSEMPDVATQAHRGPRSQGSDHGSKSQRAGTEKRAGERLLPSRSNSTRKGTHHVVKRPDQAGRRGPARGPTHLHPTRDTTVNPTTTRSYVEVVRGVAQRSGRPATVRGPPHVTRYILLPRAPTHPPQPPSAQQRHEGEGRGFVLRSPKDGLSAGTWRRKVVMCPRRGNDPASGHPRAHQPPLGRGTSPPAWDGRLDAPGQRRRHLPSSAWTRRREVKQGKSGGSVGTTDQGKGKGRSVVRPMGTVAYRGKGQGKGKGRGEGRLGQGGRGRSKGGEKLMGTTAYGGKGSKGRAANGDRPVGAASCRRDHHTMASCQNPLRPCVSDLSGYVTGALPRCCVCGVPQLLELCPHHSSDIECWVLTGHATSVRQGDGVPLGIGAVCCSETKTRS